MCIEIAYLRYHIIIIHFLSNTHGERTTVWIHVLFLINCFVAGLGSSSKDHVANIKRMSDVHCRTLMVNKGHLCRFIDTGNGLLDELLSREVISPSDDNDIRSMPGYDEKARRLLDILATKDDDAFDAFINALNETGQPHVIYILTGEISSQHQNEERKSVPMSEEHWRALTVNSDQLSKFMDTENGLLDRLLREDVISFNDAQQTRYVSGFVAKTHKLIEVLTRKSEAAFDGFIEALNETGQSHVTYMLTGEGNSRPLKEEYRKMLTTKRDYLVQMIESKNSGLITALMRKEVFSEYDEQRVTGVQPDTYYNRNELILNLIARKSQSDFFKFLSALNETDQTHVVVNIIGADVVNESMILYESGADRGHKHDVDEELLEYLRELIQRDGDFVRRVNRLSSYRL